MEDHDPEGRRVLSVARLTAGAPSAELLRVSLRQLNCLGRFNFIHERRYLKENIAL